MRCKSFDRYTGSLPLEEDNGYYKAGQRTSKATIGLWKAEQVFKLAK